MPEYDKGKQNWEEISSNNWSGIYDSIEPTSKDEDCWDIFIVKSPKYYLGITINSSSLSRKLNKKFYIDIVKTFKSKE
ncbi:MAG: hypothetical protein HRT89_09660 [Lentisphaeria bacterium]|nr:hypothetical protein [Lentisphaeria bacterium]